MFKGKPSATPEASDVGDLGSVSAIMNIDNKGDMGEGSRFIDFWVNAILADLTVYWNACRPGALGSAVPALASAARRWFTDAWSRSTGPRSQFQVKSFTILVYEKPKQRGRVLAEVDVLTGRHRIF